ncbi:MAG: ral secretion pathway protein, partial [Verrucomicrobiaceae bacterium]|nr:ral secretion pathway protein [Verrucomicrobiaceae bacterium]
AVDGSGKEVSGSLEAPDRVAAVRQLSGRGMQPFKVAEEIASAAKAKVKASAPAGKAGAKGAAAVPAGPIKMSNSQVQVFAEELSELLEAGMRLEPALALMAGKGETAVPYRLVSRKLGDLVREGHPFHSSLRLASPSFGELFSSVAAAGEASGSLGTAMKRQAAYLSAASDIRSKVAVALIYPTFLTVAGIGVTILFMTFLVPKLMDLIKSSRGGVPPMARFIMGTSEFLGNYWLHLLLTIIVLITSFVMFIRSPGGKPVWDAMKLKLPFAGGVLQASFHSQFLETLASLSTGGLPLLRGLELASRVTLNSHIHTQLTKATDAVRDGSNLSRALERTSLFPVNMIEMVRLGEHTGDLPGALRRSADRCAKDLGRALEKVAAAMQPVIILLMAGVIGVMAYLMISIIFDTVKGLHKSGHVSMSCPSLHQTHSVTHENVA